MRSDGTLALALALCAAPVRAEDGKTVNVYNWSDYIAPEAVRGFESETGIKVVYDVYDSNEILEAELLAGRSDYDLASPRVTRPAYERWAQAPFGSD